MACSRLALFLVVAASGCAVSGDGGTDARPDAGADEPWTWPDVDLDPPSADLAGEPEARDPGGSGDQATVDGTEDGGPGNGLPKTISLECSTAADCATACGGACQDGRCVVSPPQGLCFVETGDAGTCYGPLQVGTVTTCLVCNPSVDRERLVPFVLREGFEPTPQGAAGPVVEDLSGGGLVWSLSTARVHGGKSSLHFGDPSSLTYSNGKRVASAVHLPPVAVPAGTAAALEFFLWLDTEGTEGYDVLAAVARSGGEEFVVFSSDEIGGTTGGHFLPIHADLSALAGRTVALSLVFDSIDEGMNSYEGAYVDDLQVVTGCCGVDQDCDDGNPCTDDSCAGVGLECSHVRRADCCVLDQDCSDGDACTADRCSEPGGRCSAEPIPGCCHTSADCDDADPCTEDACAGDGGQCGHRPLCCADAQDCVAPDPCLEGSCQDGVCAYTDTCCHSDAACDDGDPCTMDACEAGACEHRPANIPGCCFPLVCESTFEGGGDPWAVDPLVDGIGWQVVSSRSHSSPSSLYYGDPAEGVFNKGANNSGSAVSPPFVLPAGIELSLSFWVWLDTEGDWWTTEGSLTLYLLADGKEFSLWSTGWSEPQQEWVEKVVDISAFGGREVRLRLYFESTYWDDPWLWEEGLPESSTAGEGVFVDSIEVRSTCAAKSCEAKSDCGSADSCLAGACIEGQCSWTNACCSSDAECDDLDICTVDSCGSSEHCIFNEIENCCASEGDCHDGNPCTIDVCPEPGGQCQHQAIAGCCVGPKDCDDQDPCTKDTCAGGECQHADVCCETDEDCSDGESTCTTDMCVDKFCKHVPTGADGCCQPKVLEASFEEGLDGFVLDPPAGGVGWWRSDHRAYSGDWALYYGDPASLDYDNGKENQGDAASPEVTLPPGTGVTLSLRAWLDTETDADYDSLSLFWVEGESEYQLWRKKDKTSQQKFVLLEVDLSAFAGRTGRVVIRFETLDDTVNDTEGVYVDAIELTSTCQPLTCAVDGDCSDALAFTVDSCLAGECSYWFADPECTDDWDCDDYDSCTTDSCVGGVCENELDPDCWWY